MFYSSFNYVKDGKFHELLRAYIEAREQLSDYIGYEE